MRIYAARYKYGILVREATSPTFNFFYNALGEGYPCILSYIPYKGESHSVNVYGAFIRYSSSGKQYNYLGVADGWNSTPRYILYDPDDYFYTQAIAFQFYKRYK